MKFKIIFVVIGLAFTLIPITGFADDAGKKAALADLVRAMGYGCGIHNFKNYVLRGEEKYSNKAVTCFADAKKAIAAFRVAAPTDKETITLLAIEGVVDAYNSNVAIVIIENKAGKTAKQTDSSVKIGDAPAIKGIAALRKGYEWSALEQAEYALGYGGAIHQFKNYMLRGSSRYKKAMDKFTVAETALTQIKDQPSVKDVLEVISQYKAELDVLKKMIDNGKTAEEIDDAVKINDGLAIKGLAALKGK